MLVPVWRFRGGNGGTWEGGRVVLRFMSRWADGPRRGREAFALHVPRRRPAAATSSFTYAHRPPGHGGAWLAETGGGAIAERAPPYRVPPAPDAADHHGHRHPPAVEPSSLGWIEDPVHRTR